MWVSGTAAAVAAWAGLGAKLERVATVHPSPPSRLIAPAPLCDVGHCRCIHISSPRASLPRPTSPPQLRAARG